MQCSCSSQLINVRFDCGRKAPPNSPKSDSVDLLLVFPLLAATEEVESEQDESEEEEALEEETSVSPEEDFGVEYLLKQDEDCSGEGDNGSAPAPGPKKEITDIAAAAESLQPKGYTLATTQVSLGRRKP